LPREEVRVSSQQFRAGVVIVVRHPDRQHVLVFERADATGSWQLPQGGLDVGEEAIEETGLDAEHVVARAEYPDWVAYEWPPEIRASARHGDKRIGQVQKWFLFDALHAGIVPTPDGSEFVAWQWVTPEWLIGHVVEWRQGAYRRVLSDL
jgi:putative (di)nucleoside polyphosphate hydrolase